MSAYLTRIDPNDLVPYCDHQNAPKGKHAVYVVIFPNDGSDALLLNRPYGIIGRLSPEDAKAFKARCHVVSDWTDYETYGLVGDAFWFDGWATAEDHDLNAPPRLEVGDSVGVYRNQGVRDAEVIAVLDGKALIEYEMPNGTSALNIIDVTDVNGNGGYRAVGYYRVPDKWLRAILDSIGNHWLYGRPQQNGGRLAPLPREILGAL